MLKYNIRGGGDHHLGPQVLLAVELDALFDGDEADLAMDQRFHDLDHLPAVGDGFHGSANKRQNMVFLRPLETLVSRPLHGRMT